MPGDHEPLYDALEAARRAVRRAQGASGALARALDVAGPVVVAESKRMLAGLATLEAAPDMTGCRRAEAAWTSRRERCDRILEVGDKLLALRKELGERLPP